MYLQFGHINIPLNPVKVSAIINSSFQQHELQVQTSGSIQSIALSPKANGFGSSVNGGEFLMLSLATCFCNDLYREAAKKNISIEGTEIECSGDFGAEGAPGSDFRYKANVISKSPAKEIEALTGRADRVAEIHNTLRTGVDVTLVK